MESDHTSLLLGVLGEESQLIGGDQGEGSGAGNGLGADVLSELGGVSLETLTFARSTDLNGTETDNAGVDTAGDAVLLLDVDLGQVEVLLVECKVVFDVSLGGAVNEVTHLESLDGLVLGAHLGAVEAANDVRVALVRLVPSVISSFGWHNLIIINSHKVSNTPFHNYYFVSTQQLPSLFSNLFY